MKRFWTDVALVEQADKYGIALDSRPLKTPARSTLLVPSRALAESIANEWRACGETIQPRAMPLTGLANAAIDHVAPDPQSFAASIARYAEADLLSYRADHPPRLVDAQSAAWQPLVNWAERRFAIDLVVGTGIIHLPQPPETVARLSAAVHAAAPFELAALAPLVTIGGSLITPLALLDQAIDVATAWTALSVDDQWQIHEWGADDEAVAALANRRADFEAAARFLALIR